MFDSRAVSSRPSVAVGHLLSIAFRILVAALVAGGAGCSAGNEPPETAEREEVPDQEVLDFSLTETMSGSKSWTLFADRAEVFGGRGYSRLHGVKVLFYGPEEEVTSVLTAQRGRVNDKSRDLQAFGQVVLETSEGVKLETETLRWDNRRGRIWSNEFVKLTREGEVLTGYGLDSDPDLDNVEIHSQVKIRVKESAGAG